jgi:hypothetical protein
VPPLRKKETPFSAQQRSAYPPHQFTPYFESLKKRKMSLPERENQMRQRKQQTRIDQQQREHF